ncbi:MAG: tyrosine-type recombinase/integrase, partial [Clostridia bacterium]|nr:tyrosine-type recombinase/integrase [Clostridia bacterium]
YLRKPRNSSIKIENRVPRIGHTFATMLYDAGTDILSAQHFLGHADVETTLKVYTHLSAEKQQVAVDQLNEYLSKKIEGMRTLVKI